jgi:hypothetical protein
LAQRGDPRTRHDIAGAFLRPPCSAVHRRAGRWRAHRLAGCFPAEVAGAGPASHRASWRSTRCASSTGCRQRDPPIRPGELRLDTIPPRHACRMRRTTRRATPGLRGVAAGHRGATGAGGGCRWPAT